MNLPGMPPPSSPWHSMPLASPSFCPSSASWHAQDFKRQLQHTNIWKESPPSVFHPLQIFRLGHEPYKNLMGKEFRFMNNLIEELLKINKIEFSQQRVQCRPKQGIRREMVHFLHLLHHLPSPSILQTKVGILLMSDIWGIKSTANKCRQSLPAIFWQPQLSRPWTSN